MRAVLLALAALALAPPAAAHADPAEHGRVFVSAWGDGTPTRLVETCAFHVEGGLEAGWDAGRLLLLRADESGGLVVAHESEWRRGNGTTLAGPAEARAGVYVAGVELSGEHGAYSESFRVLCGEPICPREGCPTLHVSSSAGAPRPAKVVLGFALAAVACAGVMVAARD